ncbi:MAG: MFS transporter [Rhizomicrobium sp.]
MAAQRISNWQKAAYVALVVPMSALHAPALSMLPALYAKYTGIGVATVGIILTVTRLFDVVIDPVIGYVSDRTETRWGRRKPWIAVGAVISMVSVYFWFRPGPDTGVWYFLFASVAVYLGWTLVEIPHSAWYSELTHDYDERSTIAGWRTAAMYVGLLAFTLTPLLPIFPTSELTPQVTAFASWIVIGLIPICAGAAIFAVPRGDSAPPSRPTGLRDVVRAAIRSVPLRILTVAFGLANVASGMCGAMYFFYLDAYLGILDKIAYVGLITTVLGFASTLFWPALINRLGKHRALALTTFSTAATLVAMGLIHRGPYAFPALMAVFGLSSLLATGSMITLSTMMADAVDYDEWKTGLNKAGNFFAFSAIYQKVGNVLGGGIALVIAGAFGFNPRGANGTVALVGFFLAFLVLPFILNLVAAFAALRFPITRGAQRAIRSRLARRARNVEELATPLPT